MGEAKWPHRLMAIPVRVDVQINVTIRLRLNEKLLARSPAASSQTSPPRIRPSYGSNYCDNELIENHSIQIFFSKEK